VGGTAGVMAGQVDGLGPADDADWRAALAQG